MGDGSQAAQKGVHPNMWIHHIQGQPYSSKLMKEKMAGNEDYELTFVFPKADVITTIFFSPGKLGLVGKWAIGRVTGIHEGSQAAEQGVQQGMVMKLIDGEPYSKQLLDAKIAGTENFEVAFAFEAGQATSSARSPRPDDLV